MIAPILREVLPANLTSLIPRARVELAFLHPIAGDDNDQARSLSAKPPAISDHLQCCSPQ
jgi:hypothetical protein